LRKNSLLLIFFLSLFFVACDQGASTEASKALLESSLQTYVQDLVGKENIDEFKKLTTKDAPEELKKLRQYEYKVITLTQFESDEELELQLNKLGNDGWDCFNLDKRLICKRRPETMLRFVPNTLLGR
jgi:hypothetical protein